MISREVIDRLLDMCRQPRKRGEWKAFCKQQGVHYKTTLYWRKKLSLPSRAYGKQKCPTISVTLIAE